MDDPPTVISSQRRAAAPDAQHIERLVGRQLGHYELHESVGMGGMAAVIRATDLDLGRTVALKILPPDMAADPENIERFKQEARAAAKLDHENVARVYYCGEDQGLHFIAFEFVEGENLRVMMEKRGGSLPVAESVHYLIQVTAGLSHAAWRGVVHRDIKPSNIIITPEGKAKIVDMGLARNLDTPIADGQLTRSGVTLGTFDYISPEQAIEPRLADCRSDIYSLGCTFYHILTGRTVVPEGTAAKKLNSHQYIAPQDPRELNPDIPDELAAVLGKMMAKDVNLRYQHPDHLLQHLLMIAQQLKIPTSPGLMDSGRQLLPFADGPLPAPPTLSPFWIGVAAIALVIGLFVIGGGFEGKKNALNSQPFWQDPKSEKEARGWPRPLHDGKQPGNIVTAPANRGPREARTAAELIALLKQGVAHVKLRAGAVYDLSRHTDADMGDAVFEGGSLVIENNRLLDPPTVRLAMAAADDGKSPRPGSLTFRGPQDGSPAKVLLRGIRFEFVGDDAEPGQTGVSFLDVDQIDIQECTFVAPAMNETTKDGPTALALNYQIKKETSPQARFDHCYFAPGSIAVELVKNGPALLKATQCAFGPQFVIFRVHDASSGESDQRPAQLQLESCTALMSNGAVVEIGDQVACKIQAGHCLFSNPELPQGSAVRAFVIRQLGGMAAETRFEGSRTADAAQSVMPNGYQNVLAYADDEESRSFDDCKMQMLPIEDVAARILKKSPWKDEQPITRLYDFPRQMPQVQQVFTVDMKQEVLRLEPDRNRNLLGTKYLPGMRISNLFPFEPAESEVRLPVNHKVWQPDFMESNERPLPPNVYRSLVKAIDDLKKGDVLLIRHNGFLEVDPAEFKKPDTDVTIRPDENFNPILVPRAPTLKKDQALFKLYGGQLVLENLRFRLKPDRAPAIVALPGGGQCTFRNCAATLEEGEDLAMVSLADPRGEMMMGMSTPEKWPVPKITLENSFVRGRGRALHVHGSRPFELNVKGSLVVLDGSLIGVEPSQADLSEAAPAQVALDQVTTYLTKSVLAERANEKRVETKGPGLVQVQIHAVQCVFVPAAESATLVQLDRIDSIEQMENVFQWKDGRQNVYGFKTDQVMLQITPENVDTSMRLERIERDRWLGKWREADYTFGEVNFSVVPATRRFDGVKIGDFELKSVNPPLKSDGPTEVGAPVQSLRKLAIDEGS